jgi:peroxiredoxin 2/4
VLGKRSPDFSCDAVIGGTIKRVALSDFRGRYKLLFFYPADFSFVCPTELYALQEKIDIFSKLQVVILGISTDTVYSHWQWLSHRGDDGGIQGVTFPLLGDITKSVVRAYDMLDEGTGMAHRAYVIIDKNDIVQVMHKTSSSLGRSIEEIVRLFQALREVEAGEHLACPANWVPGKDTIVMKRRKKTKKR